MEDIILALVIVSGFFAVIFASKNMKRRWGENPKKWGKR